MGVAASLLAAPAWPSAAQEPNPAPPAAQPAPPASCAKKDFEAVVDEAGEALRNLNQQKRPDFEERLRQLKDKRGWSHDEFLKQAAPFVKDETIETFDTASNTILAVLATAGDSGNPSAAPPGCATLLELRAQMKVLIETQNAKWTYMFGKLDAELAK